MKKIALTLLFAISITHATKIINGVEKKVVYVGTVCDMFHAGHVNILKNSKALGDYLIVGITTDEDALKYKRTPILTFDERKSVVEACKYVDEVIEDTLDMTKEFIEKNGIDIVVHGSDMNEETLKTFYKVPMEMGIMRVLPYTPGISTSNIIQRIISRADEFKK